MHTRAHTHTHTLTYTRKHLKPHVRTCQYTYNMPATSRLIYLQTEGLGVYAIGDKDRVNTGPPGTFDIM
jgi:hypothetical protein